MARATTFTDTSAEFASGAFEIDTNIATVAGYSTLAAGSALALGVGVAVAPAPVLGLTAIGGEVDDTLLREPAHAASGTFGA